MPAIRAVQGDCERVYIAMMANFQQSTYSGKVSNLASEQNIITIRYPSLSF